jgi:hypothetical protein
MQKLMALINWSGRPNKDRKSLARMGVPIIVSMDQPPTDEDADTRPTYRIGKHDPADIQKAIDLAG